MRRKNIKGNKVNAQAIPLLQELVRRDSQELADDFRKFVEAAWPIVEPGQEFIGGTHVDAICEHMQAAYERKFKKLLINVPPRHSKSTICSVLFPAWVWTNAPHEKFLCASYSSILSISDATKSRRLIESDWYRERWPHVVLEDDNNLKSSYENTYTGKRQTTSVSGTVTGLGGTILIVDDPHNIKDAESSTVREQAVAWFRESWSSRANNKDAVKIVIGQRVHANDVSAYCESEGDWVHLHLPMTYDGKKKDPTPLGWQDPREGFGDVLWPNRYERSEVDGLKRSLGEYAYASQYQQTPVPRGGGIIKKAWLRFWYDPAQGVPDPVPFQTPKGDWRECGQAPLPDKVKPTLASFDLAFKGGPTSDFVVGQVWGRAESGAGFYLLHQDRARRDFPSTLACIKEISTNYDPPMTLVEEAANGAAAIAVLKHEIPGLVAVRPEGGKDSRASAMAPLFEAGQVYLPHPDQCPWVAELIEELTLFPKAPNDDQVDAMSQAMVRLRERKVEIVSLTGEGTDQGNALDYSDASWVN